MSYMTPVRRCPFCKATSTKIVSNVVPKTKGERLAYYVKCNRCNARGGKATTKEFAIAKWNGTYWI